MKVVIPENLKQEVPQNQWGKVLTATPVVMTVVATMLAGLASSEMTRAQYDRALAAQQQSKAGDQWSFFQAKRLRAAIQRNSYDMLLATMEVAPFTLARLAAVGTGDADLRARLETLAKEPALAQFERGELPAAVAPPPLDADLQAAMEAVENSKADVELVPLLNRITDVSLEEHLRAARDAAQGFDAATRPVNQLIDNLDKLIESHKAALAKPAEGPAPAREFAAARFRFAALRYETEARLNQSIANLYELQVRKSNISAERHHARSQRFFFGMLAAQMAVIIATFAIAARQRNFLWTLAAVAGLAAIALAIYVYVFV